MSSPWAPRARTGACTRCACAAATRATPSPVTSARSCLRAARSSTSARCCPASASSAARRSSGTSPRSCATASGSRACGSRWWTARRARSTRSSRASSAGGCCTNCPRPRRRRARSTSSSISPSRAPITRSVCTSAARACSPPSLQRAFREALLAFPAEEYDWFEIHRPGEGHGARSRDAAEGAAVDETEAAEASGTAEAASKQRAFFEYAGPLFSVRVAPASCVVRVNESRTLCAVPRDRSRHTVEHDLRYRWEILEGEGRLDNVAGEIVTFHAAPEPGLVRIRATVTQGEIECAGEAMVTVTDSLLPEPKEPSATRQGLPGYTFQRAPGELWRSRYDAEQNVVVINNGHRDFVFAARNRALKLRYIARLYAKELLYKNFPGYAPEQLLERMIELSLYTEEH